MKRPIYEMLKTASSRLSMHMPAHHGKALFNYDLFSLDTTELDCTDNLYKANSAIKEAQDLLAKSCACDNAVFLHDGSTAGIQAMLCYVRHFGNKIIVSRNSHKSLYNFAAIIGLELICINEEYIAGVPCINADVAINVIKENRDAVAVFITSPNYYGVFADIKRISEVAHKNRMLLLVDEAHGAHLNWTKYRKNAIFYGADIVVQSAHKTLPCLTSSAWLLSNYIDKNLLVKSLASVQTSSPSFLNMMIMDDVRAYMDEKCDFGTVLNLINNFYEKIRKTSYVPLSDIIKNYDVDILRISLYCPQGAYIVQKALADENIDIEMADDRYIVCIISLLPDVLSYQLDKLYAELIKFENINIKHEEPNYDFNYFYEKKLNIKDAYFAKKELVSIEKSVGRISGDIVGLYPPGTPLLVWGELISQEIVNKILNTEDNHIFGIDDNKISCVLEE